MPEQRKLRNLRRDPRIALSIPSTTTNEWGLLEYLVVYGTARVTEGGAADVLQGLAHTYLGPDVVFTWRENLSTHVAADLPVSIQNTSLQTVPDYRIRAGVTWRF